MILKLFNKDNGRLLAVLTVIDKAFNGDMFSVSVSGRSIGLDTDERIDNVKVEVVMCSETGREDDEDQVAFVDVIYIPNLMIHENDKMIFTGEDGNKHRLKTCYMEDGISKCGACFFYGRDDECDQMDCYSNDSRLYYKEID